VRSQRQRRRHQQVITLRSTAEPSAWEAALIAGQQIVFRILTRAGGIFKGGTSSVTSFVQHRPFSAKNRPAAANGRSGKLH
jgi:hypothetical protein